MTPRVALRNRSHERRGETTGVAALIEGLTFAAFLGDKAYDADGLRDLLRERGAEAVIPARAKRRNPASYDAEKYLWRHPVENVFQNSRNSNESP